MKRREPAKVFPLNESPAAEEELIAMKRREPPKKIFPLNETPAAEELVAMKKRASKKPFR